MALKLLAMHGLPLSHNENQKDFATNLPNKGNANELDDEMSEIEPLKAVKTMSILRKEARHTLVQ